MLAIGCPRLVNGRTLRPPSLWRNRPQLARLESTRPLQSFNVELDRSVDLSRQATWHGRSQFSHFGVAYTYSEEGERHEGWPRDSEIGSRQLVAQRRGTGRICLLPALSWPAVWGTKGFAGAVRSTVMDTRSRRAGSPSHTNRTVPPPRSGWNSRDQGVEQESAASYEILAVMEDGAYAAFLIRHSNPESDSTSDDRDVASTISRRDYLSGMWWLAIAFSCDLSLVDWLIQG